MLLDLSENRNTAAKVPRLEENNKGLNLLIQQLNKEKAELCELVSSLRDQLNDIEEEKTNAKNDESLMKQKLAEGDTATALKLAERAFALKPRHAETQWACSLSTGCECTLFLR